MTLLLPKIVVGEYPLNSRGCCNVTGTLGKKVRTICSVVMGMCLERVKTEMDATDNERFIMVWRATGTWGWCKEQAQPTGKPDEILCQ